MRSEFTCSHTRLKRYTEITTSRVAEISCSGEGYEAEKSFWTGRLLDAETVNASAAVCSPLQPALEGLVEEFDARYGRRAQAAPPADADRADFALAGYDYDALHADCGMQPAIAACWHMLLYQVRSEVSAYRQVLGQVRLLKFVKAIVNAAAQLHEGMKAVDDNLAYIAATTRDCAGEARAIEAAVRANVEAAVDTAMCQALIQREYHEVAASVIAGKVFFSTFFSAKSTSWKSKIFKLLKSKESVEIVRFNMRTKN